MVCSRWYDRDILPLFKGRSVCFFVVLSFVPDVRLQGSSTYTLEDQLCLLTDNLGSRGIYYVWFLWTTAHFQVKDIVRNKTIEYLTKLAPNFCGVGRVVFRMESLTNICHLDPRLHVLIFQAILIGPCICSSIPIVCACLVVGSSRMLQRTYATSLVTWVPRLVPCRKWLLSAVMLA